MTFSLALKALTYLLSASVVHLDTVPATLSPAAPIEDGALPQTASLPDLSPSNEILPPIDFQLFIAPGPNSTDAQEAEQNASPSSSNSTELNVLESEEKPVLLFTDLVPQPEPGQPIANHTNTSDAFIAASNEEIKGNDTLASNKTLVLNTTDLNFNSTSESNADPSKDQPFVFRPEDANPSVVETPQGNQTLVIAPAPPEEPSNSTLSDPVQNNAENKNSANSTEQPKSEAYLNSTLNENQSNSTNSGNESQDSQEADFFSGNNTLTDTNNQVTSAQTTYEGILFSSTILILAGLIFG